MFAINRFRTGMTVKQESLRYRPRGELCVYFRPVTSTATTVDTLLHQQAAPYRPLQLHKTVSAYLRICRYPRAVHECISTHAGSSLLGQSITQQTTTSDYDRVPGPSTAPEVPQSRERREIIRPHQGEQNHMDICSQRSLK